MDLKFDVDKIVQYLSRFKDDLPSLYTWNADLSRLTDLKVLTESQLNALVQKSQYDQVVALKQIICDELNTEYQNRPEAFNKLCLWIIKDWGGISAGKDKDTLELIHSFLLTRKAGFKRIASLSKLASYMYPKEYIIYDSRVAYSLNWILLSQMAGNHYFPIPLGRNPKMCAFDIGVLIRQKNVDIFKIDSVDELGKGKFISNRDKKLFIPDKNALNPYNTCRA